MNFIQIIRLQTVSALHNTFDCNFSLGNVKRIYLLSPNSLANTFSIKYLLSESDARSNNSNINTTESSNGFSNQNSFHNRRIYKPVYVYMELRARQLNKARFFFLNKCLLVCVVYNRKAHIDTTIELEREVSTSHARIRSSVRASVCVCVKFTSRSKCNWKNYYLNQWI